MKKLFLIQTVIILQLIAFSVGLNAQQDDKRALTRKIMERSGMNDQIGQLPALIQSHLADRKGAIPPDLYEIFETDLTKAFDPEKILKEISRQIENNLDSKSMKDVLTWLESPLGQKITDIEKSNSTAEAFQGLEEFAALARKTPPTKKRSELVNRFNKATKTEKWIDDIQMSVVHAMLKGMSSTLPEEDREEVEVIRKIIEDMRPKLKKRSESLSTAGALYTFRTLTDDELQRYVEFAESPAGKKYHQAVLSAEKSVVERASQEFGKSLGKMKNLSLRQADHSSDKIILHLNDGRSLIWENHTEKSDRYCTYVAGGELCISKSDVARIGSK